MSTYHRNTVAAAARLVLQNVLRGIAKPQVLVWCVVFVV